MFKNRFNTTLQRKTQTVANGWQHEYYADGSIKSSGKFHESEKDGEWKHYQKGGLLLAVKNYDKGIKHGLWEKYNKEGQLIERIVYENGKRLK